MCHVGCSLSCSQNKEMHMNVHACTEPDCNRRDAIPSPNKIAHHKFISLRKQICKYCSLRFITGLLQVKSPTKGVPTGGSRSKTQEAPWKVVDSRSMKCCVLIDLIPLACLGKCQTPMPPKQLSSWIPWIATSPPVYSPEVAISTFRGTPLRCILLKEQGNHGMCPLLACHMGNS